MNCYYYLQIRMQLMYELYDVFRIIYLFNTYEIIFILIESVYYGALT